MTTASRWRISILFLIVMVLVVRWAVSPSDDGADGAIVVDRPTASAPEDRVRAHRAADAAEPSERAELIVRVVVEPPSAELDWRADLYLMATRSRSRTQIGHATRSGSDATTLLVPRDVLGIHVHTDDGVGDRWVELDTTSSEGPHEVEVEFHAHAELRGRVLTEAGKPVSGARVLFVETESGGSARGLPPDLRSEQFLDREPRSAVTGDDGAYRVAAIDPRVPYHAAATSPGFGVRREYGVVVSPGEVGRQDFVLELGCRVIGRLLDASGRPIHGARLVAASATEVGATGVSWAAEGQAESAEDGRFVFDCLGPGWKKVQTILVAEPGESVAGHWECRVDRGDEADLGDLLVLDSLYEATIRTPEGEQHDARVRFAFIPESGSGDDAMPAMLSVPVAADDSGVVRVRGLGRGRVSVVVRDGLPREDGRWRPPTRFEESFDGGHVQREWMLLPVRDSEPERVAADGAPIGETKFEFAETGDDALAISFINGELASLQRLSSSGLTIAGSVGDRLRLVVTEGERWGELELTVEGDSQVEPKIVADRVGNTLEIVVRDEGRAVPGARVFIGPADLGEDGLFPFRQTERDGRVVLRGVPPELRLCVTAMVFGSQPEPQVVEWVAGRAKIVIDVSEN